MAHHLAERMQALDHVKDEARAAAEDRVAELILAMWRERRSALSENPVELSDAVLNGVARLDVTDTARFYRHYRTDIAAADGPPDLPSLSRALQIEAEAGRLVRMLVLEAAGTAAAAEGEWLAAVRDASADPFLVLIDLISDATEDESGDPRQKDQLARSAARLRDLLAPLVDGRSGSETAPRRARGAAPRTFSEPSNAE